MKLPNVVLGYLYLKKLKMESQSESVILTATGGKLEIKEVLAAVNSIFPEGKGSSAKHLATKEVHQAEESEDDEREEMQRAMEIMAEDIQSREEWSEEEILEAFESYSDVRRKMREQKTSRGFYPKPTPDRSRNEGWQIQGSIRGRIDALKSRTRCHYCKRTGHWKKECPLRGSASSSNRSGGSGGSLETKGKEVLLVDSDPKMEQVWEMFMAEES